MEDSAGGERGPGIVPGRRPAPARLDRQSSSGRGRRRRRSTTARDGSFPSYKSAYICSVIGMSTLDAAGQLAHRRVLRTPSATSLMLADDLVERLSAAQTPARRCGSATGRPCTSAPGRPGRQARERRRVRAEIACASRRDLGEPARDQRRAACCAEAQPVAHARRDGDHVLHGAADLDADHVGRRVDAEGGAAEETLQLFGDRRGTAPPPSRPSASPSATSRAKLGPDSTRHAGRVLAAATCSRTSDIVACVDLLDALRRRHDERRRAQHATERSARARTACDGHDDDDRVGGRGMPSADPSLTVSDSGSGTPGWHAVCSRSRREVDATSLGVPRPQPSRRARGAPGESRAPCPSFRSRAPRRTAMADACHEPRRGARPRLDGERLGTRSARDPARRRVRVSDRCLLGASRRPPRRSTRPRARPAARRQPTRSPSSSSISRTPCVLRPITRISFTRRRIDLAAARHEHDLIVVRHHADPDDPAGLVGGLHGDDALAAAMRASVLVHRRALAVAVLGDGEQRAARLDQIDAPRPRRPRRASCRGRRRSPRPIGRTSASSKRMAWPSAVDRMISRVPSVRRTPTTSSPSSSAIAMSPDGARRRVLHQVGLLDETASGGEDEIAAVLELAHRQECGQLLLGLELQQVRRRCARARRGPACGISWTFSQ